MTPAMPLSTNTKHKAEGCCATHQQAKFALGAAERESFSRASDFAFALVPIVLGVGYAMLFRDAEGSLFFRLGVFSFFILTLGAAVSLLSGVGLVEDSERK